MPVQEIEIRYDEHQSRRDASLADIPKQLNTIAEVLLGIQKQLTILNEKKS